MIPYFDGFNLSKHVIILDDVKYDYAPESIQFGYGDGYGVVGDTVLTAGLSRVSQVQTVSSTDGWWSVNSGDTDPTNKLTSNSVSTKMAWNCNWNQNSPMNVCMRDHLMGLSSTQRPFWIQFDEEMSREGEKLYPIDATGERFQLPTYPVAYFTTASDTADKSYNVFPYIQIFDETDTLLSQPVLINKDTGLIVTEVPQTYIKVKYLWRAFVRVKAISLDNIQWSQNIYGGTVSFEQVATEPVVDRFDNKYVIDNCIRYDEDIDTTDDSLLERTNCPCLHTDVLNITKASTTSTCLSTDDLYNTGAISIPANHYVTGVEILDFVGGRQLHCVTPLNETVVKSRLKFGAGSSPAFSSFYEKQTQTDALQNHAIINATDVPASATDISFGGRFDLFGKPIGVYKGADLLSGILFNNVITVPSTSNCGAYLGSLSATITNGLTAVTKKNAGVVSPTSSGAYSLAGTTATLPMVELTDSAASAAILEAYTDGNLTFNVTGPAGARMTTIRLQLSITLESTAVQQGRTYILETSIGQVTVAGDAITKTITLDKTFIVPLTSGSGTLVVPLYYYAKASFAANAPGQTTTYKAKVSGSLTYTLGYGCASSPTINNFGVRIYHAPSCPTVFKYHTTSEASGSANSLLLGNNGSVLESSDGTTTGSGEVFLRDYDFPLFEDDSIMVGAIARFMARRVGAPSAATNLITNGNFSAGNTGFTSEYTYNGVDGFGNLDEGSYGIVTNPNTIHSLWYGFTDHTTGTNPNMMVVNGEQGIATVEEDWDISVTPTSGTATESNPASLNTTHTITATYIGSSPTPPEYVVVGVPTSFLCDCELTEFLVEPDHTCIVSFTNTLGDSYTYNGPGDPVVFRSFYREITIPLVSGVGTRVFDMDTTASWTNSTITEVIMTHTVGEIEFVSSDIFPTEYFWRQVPTLTPLTTYTFEYYARKINSAVTPNADPTVRVKINGTTVSNTTITSTSSWTKVSFNYTTGAGTSYDIRMSMPNGSLPGNDVAIDDISLTGPSGVGSMFLHLSTEESGNPSKQFTLPTSSEWVSYQLGSDTDFWGYGAGFTEIPRDYPTATGVDMNNFTGTSLVFENNVGGYYEFKDIKLQFFMLNNCNEGIILE